MSSIKAKRMGRPPLSGETGKRYQVTIPPTIADKLRAYGDGSLSAGIVKAALWHSYATDCLMKARAAHNTLGDRG